MATHNHQQQLDPIKHKITDSIQKVFFQLAPKEQAVVDADTLFNLIEKPPEAHMGDYALPCFQFAKTLRKNPKIIGFF